MKRLALLSIPLFCSTPTLAADFDGPTYRGRDVVIEREAPPRIIEDRRVVEHYHYYVPAPVYTERVYREPRVHAYYDRPYHTYSAWRPRHHFFPHRHRHHHRW